MIILTTNSIILEKKEVSRLKIISLRRYPVKSMMGEELNACDLTENGIYGDRMYGVIDKETGKLANAKNPKKWPTMFRYHSTYREPVTITKTLPHVQIMLPSGDMIYSNDHDIDEKLTESFNREVMLRSPSQSATFFEGYVPKEIEELADRGTIFSRQSPTNTFFDIAFIHIITTNTINSLRKLLPESRIEARRFRPNIIIDVPDEEGFVEESWVNKTLQIGKEVKLNIIQPTKRCVMTTLAQGDLPNDIHVLKTLVKKNEGNFGVYAEIIQPGQIKVDDKVKVLDL